MNIKQATAQNSLPSSHLTIDPNAKQGPRMTMMHSSNHATFRERV